MKSLKQALILLTTFWNGQNHSNVCNTGIICCPRAEQEGNSEISDLGYQSYRFGKVKETKTKLTQLWKKIAERYKDNKWIGGYDLINETNWDLPGGVAVRDIYERITTEIEGVGD